MANLFSSLHRWAHRQDENYITEAFVSVLRVLQSRSPGTAAVLLARLTAGATIPEQSVSQISFETQVRTPAGIPDVRIHGAGVDIFVEAKVAAAISRRQLEAYTQQLAQSDAPARRLVLLSHFPPSGKDLPPDLVAVRWYEIGEWIEQLLAEPGLEHVCQHYLGEFLGFLRDRGLAVQAITSPISQALAAAHRRTGKPLLEGARFKSIDRLAELEELVPLVALLRLMDLALMALPTHQAKFDTGKHRGGWVGFNLNSTEYFFDLYLNEPTALYFEAFGRYFDPTAWDGVTGETYFSFGRRRWRNRFDLDARFLALSKDRQLAALEAFVTSSHDHAQRATEPEHHSVGRPANE